MLLIGLLSFALTGTASAQTYWLNMVTDGESMSLAVATEKGCTEAANQYVRSQIVNFVSCDVKPLPDAVNIGS